MQRHIELSPEADDSLLSSYQHIHRADPAAAERFFDAVLEMLLKLADEPPGLGSTWISADRSLARVRYRHLLQPFDDYLIIFKENKNRVCVLAVIDGARGVAF